MNTKLILNDQILVDTQSGEVKSKNQPDAIRLEPLLLDLLLFLTAQPQTVISREQIIEALWAGDQRVGNPALTKAISKLRHLFTQHFNTPDLIETLPKKGYRFTADIKLAPNYLENRIFNNKHFPYINSSLIKRALIQVLALFIILIALKFILGVSFHHLLHKGMH
ncbi:MAG: transcriptional regulator [Saprospiraceae bacterium]